MESPQNDNDNNEGSNYWGTLINPDKSPAPLLEHLCIGLAQLMAKLDSSSGSSDLTPDKLARFYREVGANYDTLFLDTKGPALSFLYQSLGCFHTLQPTTNPFEPPSIPALLPSGFVRWQVINLLLCPDEHAQYLQAALSRWDVPNPCGGTFPKVIPRDAFPQAPDRDMVQWHEIVSNKLQQEHADRKSPSRPRRFPSEFVRYYSAATGARKYRHPEEYGFYNDNKNNHPSQEGNNPTPMPRGFFDDEPVEEVRRYRRHWSPDDRARRRQIFSDDSRTSSRNPSPRQQTASPASTVRIPMRAKTTHARNRESPEYQRSSFREHRPMNSSDSSNQDDGRLPRRRHGSIDDGYSSYFSPVQDPPLPRRHSHDVADIYPNNSDQESNLSSRKYRAKRNSSRPRQYKFYEPPPHANQPSPYEIKTDVPRVYVRYDGSPSGHRGQRHNRGESGSSGSDRPRSSSNGSGETAWNWKGWNRPSRRRVSHNN